jgi:hypothetical protein
MLLNQIMAARAANSLFRPFIPLAVLLLAWGAATAQNDDCTGFWENDIASGGTNGATSVFAADINRDGHIDVISASYNDDTIAWYENNRATPPEFTQHVITTSADGVAAVYAVDIDDDGDVDVLSASPYDDTIALYENIGTATPAFAKQVLSDTADHALAVFAADVDGDGDTDVLSGAFVGNEIAWYENPAIENPDLNPEGGSPYFVKRVISSSVSHASSVFAIDIDGDGDTDVLSASVSDDKISWHENSGTPSGVDDWTEHEVSTSADGAKSVFAADMDNDGDPDVLSASISDNKIAWYENRGALCDDLATVCSSDSDCSANEVCLVRFTTYTIANTADGAKSVLVADINDDPYPDVLAASEGDNTIAWYENSGDPSQPFVEHTVSSETESADAVFAADLDSDGDMDILSASSVPGSISSSDKIAWFENSGAVSPWTERAIAETAEGANALFPGDVDSDGDFDLVAATSSGKVVWFEIEGTAEPEFTRHVISDDVPGATSVHVFDLDNDGDKDIVAASADRDRVLWYANDNGSPGDFGPAQIITSNASSVESVFVADIDGNGHPDVLSASSGDDKIAWYESDGLSPPGFTERIISSSDSELSPYVTVSAKSVFATDLDSDGDMDVLSASSGDDKIAWFENDGLSPPGFVEHIIASDDSSEAVYRADGAHSVFAADIDDDGNMDILSASSYDHIIAWYEQRNEADGESAIVFTRHVVSAGVFFAVFVAAFDMDDDGDLDVLSTSLGDDRVAWYENDIDTDGGQNLIFMKHVVVSDGDNPRTVVARDLTGDGRADLFAGFRFKTSWFEQIDERCVGFDANGDDVMDGIELAWIGRAFGQTSDDPPSTWWYAVDYNQDGIVDGDDLAILALPTVWGETTDECSFTCQ